MPAPAGPRSVARRRYPAGAVVGHYHVGETSSGEPVAITAAAEVIMGPSVARSKKRPPVGAWQTEAWNLRREIGEFRFAGDRPARALSLANLFIARVDPESDDRKPVPVGKDDDLDVRGLGDEMFGNRARTQQALKRAGQQLSFNGESLLTVAYDDRGKQSFTPYSVRELTGVGAQAKVNDGLESRKLEADEVVIRCWTPDPEFSALADAPAQSVMPVARELRGLTEHTSAQIDSRLAGAGLLLVPQSISVLSGQFNGDPGAMDPFVAALLESMTVPIQDRNSASALVPLVAKVPDEAVDKIKHVKFESSLDPQAQALREEAIKRVALGMDSPPEVLLGMGSANHWSAWQVSEEEAKLVIAPMAATVCHALTVGWLHPALEQLGIDGWEDYQVWFDLSALELRPDKSGDAQALFDKGELSADAMLRESGFNQSDKPDDAERERALLVRLLLANPALATALLPAIGIELDLPVAPAEDASVPSAEEPVGDAGPDAIGPPETQDAPPPAADAGVGAPA
jgi:hypothetical protein